jgi:hypothetical protein
MVSARLESLRPTSYAVHYPRWMAGKPLLYISCALASLGDALFGYSQGITATSQVQPNFILRMFHETVTEQQVQLGQVGINPFTQGLSSCPRAIFSSANIRCSCDGRVPQRYCALFVTLFSIFQ